MSHFICLDAVFVPLESGRVAFLARGSDNNLWPRSYGWKACFFAETEAAARAVILYDERQRMFRSRGRKAYKAPVVERKSLDYDQRALLQRSETTAQPGALITADYVRNLVADKEPKLAAAVLKQLAA